MQLRDRAVLVTGASAGIGMAAARLMSECGASLALVARRASAPRLLLSAQDAELALARMDAACRQASSA